MTKNASIPDVVHHLQIILTHIVPSYNCENYYIRVSKKSGNVTEISLGEGTRHNYKQLDLHSLGVDVSKKCIQAVKAVCKLFDKETMMLDIEKHIINVHANNIVNPECKGIVFAKTIYYMEDARCSSSKTLNPETSLFNHPGTQLSRSIMKLLEYEKEFPNIKDHIRFVRYVDIDKEYMPTHMWHYLEFYRSLGHCEESVDEIVNLMLAIYDTYRLYKSQCVPSTAVYCDAKEVGVMFFLNNK